MDQPVSRGGLAVGIIALLALVGCGSSRCKSGTVLLTVNLPSVARAGDVLVIEVSGGGLSIRGMATLDAEQSGTVELDLPQYPKGASLTVTATLGTLVGMTQVTLDSACATGSVTLAASQDLSASPADLSPAADLTAPADLSECSAGNRRCAGGCAATSDPIWLSDDYACGGAGLGCAAGSTCQNGGCVAANPASIGASSKAMGNVLIVNNGRIWWASGMGIDGACDPTVAGGCNTSGNLCTGWFGGSAGTMAIAGGSLYYVSLVTGPGSIRKMAIDCSGSSPVAQTDPNAINWMTSDGASLFWTDDNGMVMEWLNATGTPGIVISSGPTHAQQLQVVTAGAVSTLYYAAWGAGATTGEVRAVPVGGTSFVQLATNQAKPTFLAIAGNNIFWTNSGDGSVWANTLDGNAGSAHAVATGQASPMGIVADASAVYWVNNGDGTVMKQPLCGGDAIVLASGQSGPTAIVAIKNNLYWLAAGANQIMTVPQ
jgi:hypothetical protein